MSDEQVVHRFNPETGKIEEISVPLTDTYSVLYKLCKKCANHATHAIGYDKPEFYLCGNCAYPSKKKHSNLLVDESPQKFEPFDFSG